MGDSIFREGGPYGTRRTGSDQYHLSIPIPKDENGMTARECTDDECTPGYFKVRMGTGLTGEQARAYCPYCCASGEPDDFYTAAQKEYAIEIVTREAAEGVSEMLKNALGIGPSGRRQLSSGLIGISMTYKSGPRPHIYPPIEDELSRDLTCPHCTLEHAVYGLASWCPDCGEDVFLTHVAREMEAIRHALSAIPSRREVLGARVAARDLENGLEDAVSVFEAALKMIAARQMRTAGKSHVEVSDFIEKRVRNNFQNVASSAALMLELFSFDALSALPTEQRDALDHTFQKRHPITHNLGIVDRKYLKQARSAAEEGRELRVTSGEIETAIGIALRVVTILHEHLFPKPPRS